MQFLWYDYETSGRNAAADRPIQLGWQYTDPGMEPVADAESVLIRLPDDVLPSPGAMLVHQITPDVHQREGISEAELAQRLDGLMAPKTLIAGYNSRHFDDKFTQHVFYRCLRDPYRWQYADGRGRFDLYPVVLAFYVFRPEVIIWPEDQDGRPRFKLDRIGPLNQLDVGLKHAHDASADVAVTARLAHRLAHHDADFFAECLKRIDKHQVTDLIRAEGRHHGLLEVTPFAGWERGYTRDLWIPFRLAEKSNDYIAFDLDQDPEQVLAGLSQVLDAQLTADARRAELRRIGVQTVRINAQPMLFRRDTLEPSVEARMADFGRDREQQQAHLETWHHIQESPAFKQLYQLARQALEEPPQAQASDVDDALYGGDFLSHFDREQLEQAPLMDPEALKTWLPNFEDPRYPELVFRYRARNFPHSLSPAEWRRWQLVRRQKLLGEGSNGLTLTKLQEELVRMSQEPLESHHIEQLQRFAAWLDNQPPI